jgi:hypothetical protein
MTLDRLTPSPAAAETAQPGHAHEAGNAFAAGCRALIGEFGPDAGHAVGLIACLVGSANALQQRALGTLAGVSGPVVRLRVESLR